MLPCVGAAGGGTGYAQGQQADGRFHWYKNTCSSDAADPAVDPPIAQSINRRIYLVGMIPIIRRVYLVGMELTL